MKLNELLEQLVTDGKLSSEESKNISTQVNGIRNTAVANITEEWKVKLETKESELNGTIEESKKTSQAKLDEITEQLTTATNAKAEFETKISELTAEVAPVREKALKAKFADVTKDLILDSALRDAMSEAEITVEDTPEEAKAKLEAIIETKPYYKKVVAISDDEALLLKKQEEKKPKAKVADNIVVSAGVIA